MKTSSNSRTFRSDVSDKEFPLAERISGRTIRDSVMKMIREDKPDFSQDNYLSLSELNYYREKYITDIMTKETGELTELQQTVLDSLSDHTTLSDKLDTEDEKFLTPGQKIADKVADFGGSWTFIISFFIFLLLWMAINVFWLANKGFDPYPFILLNLILSSLAAFQAPIIMMSQNRQEDKDRARAKNDYMINLKSELEIRTLHEKIDHMINNQQQELMEIQKVQIEIMNDILKQVEKK